MKTRLAAFNIYFLLLAVILSCGCKSPEERKKSKEASTLRLFLASAREKSGLHGVVVNRQNPISFSVEREPFLTEADLESAAVVDVPGGYAISAQFNGHGALVLEQLTVAHKGQHIAVQSD